MSGFILNIYKLEIISDQPLTDFEVGSASFYTFRQSIDSLHAMYDHMRYFNIFIDSSSTAPPSYSPVNYSAPIVVTIKFDKSEIKKCTEKTCPITLNDFKPNDEYAMCHQCHKQFHLDAIKKWLKQHQKCPHCRVDWISTTRYQNITKSKDIIPYRSLRVI